MKTVVLEGTEVPPLKVAKVARANAPRRFFHIDERKDGTFMVVHSFVPDIAKLQALRVIREGDERRAVALVGTELPPFELTRATRVDLPKRIFHLEELEGGVTLLEYTTGFLPDLTKLLELRFAV